MCVKRRPCLAVGECNRNIGHYPIILLIEMADRCVPFNLPASLQGKWEPSVLLRPQEVEPLAEGCLPAQCFLAEKFLPCCR